MQKKDICNTCKAEMPLEYLLNKYQDTDEVCECKECKAKRITYSGRDPLLMTIGDILPTLREQTRIERLIKWALG